MLTVPEGADCYAQFPPEEEHLINGLAWVRGQQERGAGGLLHWQCIAGFSRPQRLAALRRLWPGAHCEPTRSDAADAYVWKDDTSVPNTRFQLGTKPTRRNEPADWVNVWNSATTGDYSSIPEDIRVRCYLSLRRISADHLQPVQMERSVSVRWGPTGTGKSRASWHEAGIHGFPKVPTSIWWDGYRGHEHVIIDEFCGRIDISHVLRWFDRYPCNVEVKGGFVPLNATRYWITSNIDPHDWYPDATLEQRDALFRRLTTVEHVTEPINFDDE